MLFYLNKTPKGAKMKIGVKFSIIIIIITTFFPISSYSQTDSTTVFTTHSLQFKVYSLASLSSFKGMLFSYKYHLNNRNAIRLGVSAYAMKIDEEKKYERETYIKENYNQVADDTNAKFEVMIEFLKYFNINKEIKHFLGIGPRIELDIDEYDTKDFTFDMNNNYYYTDNAKRNSYEFGLTFSYGVEWFFRENMSIHAEYGCNLSYFIWDYIDADKYLDGDIYSTKIKKDGIIIDDTGALLGLSIYL